MLNQTFCSITMLLFPALHAMANNRDWHSNRAYKIINTLLGTYLLIAKGNLTEPHYLNFLIF